MHSVKRSPEPGVVAQLRASRTDWDDLDGGDRQLIRDALAQDFGPICGYCERHCQWPNRYRNSPSQETIDHFRPRDRFPDLWLYWLNLVYACHRCNQAKRGSWPEYGDQVNQKLADANSRYTPVSEYVNPNEEPSRRPAQDFFDFDIETGEMVAAEQLYQTEWSVAHRTIWDIDLNDRYLGENDPKHLQNLRRRQRDLLVESLEHLEDIESKIYLAREFASLDKPFSAFIYAYLASHFPGLV